MTNGTEKITKVAESLFDIKLNLDDREKKVLQNLFDEYLSNGMNSRNALKKAVCVLACFR